MEGTSLSNLRPQGRVSLSRVLRTVPNQFLRNSRDEPLKPFWVPVLVHTPSTFSYLQREFLLFSFMPSAAFRFTGYQGDFGFFFLTISHQVFIHNGKSHPNQSQSSHCKSNQFHLCQPLLMSDALIPFFYSHPLVAVKPPRI